MQSLLLIWLYLCLYLMTAELRSSLRYKREVISCNYTRICLNPGTSLLPSPVWTLSTSLTLAITDHKSQQTSAPCLECINPTQNLFTSSKWEIKLLSSLGFQTPFIKEHCSKKCIKTILSCSNVKAIFWVGLFVCFIIIKTNSPNLDQQEQWRCVLLIF